MMTDTEEQQRAFAIYSAQPRSTRSLKRLSDQTQIPLGTLNSWCRRLCWQARLDQLPQATPNAGPSDGGKLSAEDIERVLANLLKTYSSDLKQFPGQVAVPKGMTSLYRAWLQARKDEKAATPAAGSEASEARADLSKLSDRQFAAYEMLFNITSGRLAPLGDEHFVALVTKGPNAIDQYNSTVAAP